MRKIHFFFLFILLVTSTLVADSPIHFKKKLIDFGEVESGRVVCVNFEFENTGNKTFVIADITAMGRNFQAKLKTRTYRPGKRGSIDVTFNTKGYKGRVTKAITVFVRIIDKEKKNNHGFHRLKLTGLVNPNNPDIAEMNPEKKRVNNFGDISRKQKKIVKNNQRLFKAVKSGKAAKVKKILQKPTSIGARNLCLLMAVGQGNFEIVRSLVEISEEIDLDFQDEEQQTSLQIAFSNNSLDIFYYLIEKGANAQWYVDQLVKKKNISELERIRGLNQSLISSGDIQNIKDDLVFEQFGKAVEFSNLFEILKKYPSNRHFAKMLDKVYELVLRNKNLNEMKKIATSFRNHKLSDELLKQIAWKEKAHEYYQDEQEYEDVKNDIYLLESWMRNNRWGLENKYRRKYKEASKRLLELKREKKKNELNSEEIEILYLSFDRTSELLNSYKFTYEELNLMPNNTELVNKIAITILNYVNKIDSNDIESNFVANYLGDESVSYNFWADVSHAFGITKSVSKQMKGPLRYEELIVKVVHRGRDIVGQIIPIANKTEMRGIVNFKKGTLFEKNTALVALKLIVKNNLISKRDLIRMIERDMFEIITNKKESFIIRYQAMGVLANLCNEESKDSLINYYDALAISEKFNNIKDKFEEEISNARRLRKLKILVSAATLAKVYIDSIKSDNASSLSSSSNSGSLRFKFEGQWFFGHIKSLKIKLEGKTLYATYEESCNSNYVFFSGIPYDTYNVTIYAYEQSGLNGQAHPPLKTRVSHNCKTTDVRITAGDGGLVDSNIYVNCD